MKTRIKLTSNGGHFEYAGMGFAFIHVTMSNSTADSAMTPSTAGNRDKRKDSTVHSRERWELRRLMSNIFQCQIGNTSVSCYADVFVVNECNFNLIVY